MQFVLYKETNLIMTHVPLCRVGSWLRLSSCDMMLELESMLVDLAKVALEPPFVFHHRFFSFFFCWFLVFIFHVSFRASNVQSPAGCCQSAVLCLLNDEGRIG